MKRRRAFSVVLLAASCGGQAASDHESEGNRPSTASGGDGVVHSVGTGGDGAVPGSGGTGSLPMSGSGGTGSLPMSGSGGAPSMGAPSGGMGGDVSSGGTPSGGSGGEPSSGGSGPQPTDVRPSPACGEGSPSDGVNGFGWGGTGAGTFSVPPTYDGSTPFPLVIAFHAKGSELYDLVSTGLMNDPSELSEKYIIALPRAQEVTDTWETAPESHYDFVYQGLAEQVCFDQSRVFGIGNGGGGRYLGKLGHLDSTGDIVRPSSFRAIALLGSVHAGRVANLKAMPVVFIHAEDDSVGGNIFGDPDGQDILDTLEENAECGPETSPAGAGECDELWYECVDYGACSAPLRFCRYEGLQSYDGWTCSANIEIPRFFDEYL